MKYYIIAGEASGDLHGSNLIKELKNLDDAANIHCWGGDLMQATGATIIKHYRELAFMGFAEVVMNLRTIMNNLKFCKEDIEAFQPDVLILIDYPGFNLRISEWAKQKGFKVVFYISPQVWAWKESRVKKMKQCIDKMLVILPFEKDYYKNKWNWDVEYVGHPLVEVIDKTLSNKPILSTDRNKRRNNSNENAPIVAILPGSRKQEIIKKLPIMLQTSKNFHPDVRFILAKAPGQDDLFYESIFDDHKCGMETTRDTYALLCSSTAALVTSGTATLETALFAVPEVVCYKGSNISYQIAKRLISIKYISLVNLIMDKPVVKELIQNELTVKNLTQELSLILTNEKRITEIQKDYADLKHLLNQGGNASAKAAKSIYEFIHPA